MLREAKTIYLYLKLCYREEGTGDYLNDNEEWKPVPAGWFYKCLEYKFDDRKDISTDFSSPYSKDAKEFDRLHSVKNKASILKQLKKHNDEQLNLLFSEITYWKSEFNLSILPNPRMQKIIQFYETALIDFKHLYQALGLEFPSNPAIDPTIDSEVENSNDNKLNKNFSKIDQEIEVMEKAMRYINDKIKKLGSDYIRGDVITICAEAYDYCIPLKGKKGNINVTKYSKNIFPKLKHNIKGWKLSQFQSYLRPQISPRKQTKVPKMLGIFFL